MPKLSPWFAANAYAPTGGPGWYGWAVITLRGFVNEYGAIDVGRRWWTGRVWRWAPGKQSLHITPKHAFRGLAEPEAK